MSSLNLTPSINGYCPHRWNSPRHGEGSYLSKRFHPVRQQQFHPVSPSSSERRNYVWPEQKDLFYADAKDLTQSRRI